MALLSSLTKPDGLWNNGLAAVRVLTGIFLIYHSSQALIPEDMAGFSKWLGELNVPFPDTMPYIGKGAEFIGGICLIPGIFTRYACILLIGNFMFITLVMGHGKIFTDAQHPFLFVMLSCVFLFAGPGPWSLDQRIANRKSQ